AEAGFTTNEPDQLALQQAIEKAVYGLVLEGVDLKLWDFADTNAGWPLLWQYRQERDGVIDEASVAEALKNAPPMEPLRVQRTAERADEDTPRRNAARARN